MVPISTHAGLDHSGMSDVSSPYRGLFAFREEDAPYFFGRETFTDRLTDTLAAKAMAAVAGWRTVTCDLRTGNCSLGMLRFG